MKTLSNEALLDSYYKAIDLKLDREFVTLLLAEIKRRKLNIQYYEAQAN
ncbi:sporulation histidine kinase inhibitor Sda [Paenibacillus mesophilus]|nr:sporulation histidine kinase inhibitor Sda [Paenibacillus mesophilus]TMV44919.1 sporulation histidine kinase inhibitor Sda [Paenibacillus mesophilus]